MKTEDEMFVEIVDKVTTYFGGNHVKAIKWMITENPMLGNVIPGDMIHYGSTHKLLEFINSQLEYSGSELEKWLYGAGFLNGEGESISCDRDQCWICMYEPDRKSIQLDGSFTVKELELIIKRLKELQDDKVDME